MTKKDFFRILIKLFGVYSLIISVFTILPAQLTAVAYDLGAPGFIFIAITFIIICFIFIVLIKNPDKIIKWLHLDKGFDDDYINFRYLNNISIIKLTILIVGGFLIVDNIAPLFSYSYHAFKADVAGMFAFTINDNINWIASAGNVIIGFLMITNFEKLSVWIGNKSNITAPAQDVE